MPLAGTQSIPALFKPCLGKKSLAIRSCRFHQGFPSMPHRGRSIQKFGMECGSSRICHCEEDAGRRGNLGKALSVRTENDKTYKPIASVAARAILTAAGTKQHCLPEIAPQGHFLALRAQGATGAKRPRNGKSEAISILTIVCVSSGYASGPGV